jgi:single-strand DNA-binding protein
MDELLLQLIEYNQWHFIGRLAADPEIKYLPTGQSVCNARLLVNRPGQRRDDGQQPYGFKLAVWGEAAQSFADAARKGDLVDVEGRVKTETWNDRNTGEERRGVVLTVESFEVLARPGQGQQAPAPAPQARPATSTSPPVWGSSAGGDSDAPF